MLECMNVALALIHLSQKLYSSLYKVNKTNFSQKFMYVFAKFTELFEK